MAVAVLSFAVRVWWSFVLCLLLILCLSLCLVSSFFSTCTSRLAPIVCALPATLKFFVVATRLFFVFCVCPKFCDLAKQQRKVSLGV